MPTPNETMLKMYIGSQKNVPFGYKEHNYEMYDAINNQTLDLLNQYASGEKEINTDEEGLINDLISAYHYSSNKKQRLMAEKLHHAINKKITLAKERIKRLQNIGSLNSILNNKKEMRSMTSQEFVVALETIKTLSPQSKLRQNMEQRLKSYAQLKYNSMKENNERNKIFEAAFDLKKKTPQRAKPLEIKKAQIIEEPKKSPNKFAAFFAAGIEKIKSAAKQIKHRIKKFYYDHFATIAIGSVAATAVVGGKLANMATEPAQIPYSTYSYSNYNNDTSHQKQEATADFTQEAKKIKQSENRTQIQGDYYDTSLEIHLKSKKAVQNLYDKIDALAQTGKIKFAQGTNTKRYAHAFTMYQLIRPNSAEYKHIKNLLNGGTENAERINQLVVRAGEKGQGVKPDDNTITTSNFDNASKALQMQHLKNLQRM